MVSIEDAILIADSNDYNQATATNETYMQPTNDEIKTVNLIREFEILETNKNKAQIGVGNYLFVKNKEGSKKGKNFIYWVCKENRRSAKCKSRCITDSLMTKLIKPPSEHSHEPINQEKLNKIKKATFDPNDPTKLCFSKSQNKIKKKTHPFELLKTAKSATQIKMGNFIFHKDKECKDIIYWVCKENRKNQCKSRCSTSVDMTQLIKKPSEHNHEPYNKQELEKIQNVSNRAKISQDASKKIKLKYLKTMKLETQINLNNFLYQKNKVIDNVTYWSCKLAKKCKCRSTLRTKGPLDGDASNLILLNEPKEHNHIPFTDEQIENLKNVAKTALRKKKIVSKDSNDSNLDQTISNSEHVLVNEIEINNTNDLNIDNLSQQKTNGISNHAVPLIDHSFNFDLNINF